MHFTGFDFALWALSFVGDCALLYVIWRRRRAVLFPLFTAFVTTDVLRTVLLYAVLHFGTARAYFYAYWSLAIVDVAFQLAVVYELFTHIFRPLGVFATDVRKSAWIAVATSVGAAVGLTLLSTPPTRTWRLSIAVRGNFFSSVLVSEVFVAMIVLSVTMGYPWRTHVARLAQGLGVYSLIEVLIDAGQNYFGSDRNGRTFAALSHVRISLYLLCLAFWVVTLYREEPVPAILPVQMHEQLLALQRRMRLLLKSVRELEQS